VANLQKAVDTRGKELVLSMEKFTVLNIIDQAWKEHLREMDDLKQSVQNAVYEQKDPLLVYKFEGFELFKTFIGKVNQETVSFLMKADIPVQEASEVREARRSRRAPVLRETKAESQSVLAPPSQGERQAMAQQQSGPVEKVAPIRSEKVAGRNDRVSVQYADGSIKKDVKFKTVEEDLKNSRCVIIDQE
jgi:preprotein translocase subunit SecA